MMTKQTQRKKRPTGPNTPVGVRMPPEDLADLDAWRARQPGVPGRPEAIRQLVRIALDAEDSTHDMR